MIGFYSLDLSVEDLKIRTNHIKKSVNAHRIALSAECSQCFSRNCGMCKIYCACEEAHIYTYIHNWNSLYPDASFIDTL